MYITSKAFKNGDVLPIKHSGEGDDLSPQFEWSDLPKECNSLALICEDIDAPRVPGQDYPFAHWLIYNLSPLIHGLPEGIPARKQIDQPVRAVQGKNSFGTIGYRGPMPPRGLGPHRYIFRLYALDKDFIAPSSSINLRGLMDAMEGYILSSAEMVGTFERKIQRESERGATVSV